MQVVGRHPRVQQVLGALDTHAHAFDLKHDVDAHAVAVQMAKDVIGGDAAFVEQHAQIVDLVQQLARLGTFFFRLMGRLNGQHGTRETVERLLLHGHAHVGVAQAAAHRLRQSG